MTQIHHCAGRLRLKFPQLKSKPGHAAAVQTALRKIDGVKMVQTNTVTGSLLIHYDARRPNSQAILTAIAQVNRQHGLIMPNHSVPAKAPHSSSAGERIVDQVLGKAVETALERSMLVLLGALL